MKTYRFREMGDGVLDRSSGDVLFWDAGRGGKEIHFGCPCGQRSVNVREQVGHGIEFDEDGLLTIVGSVGSHASEYLRLPANHCHFFVKQGRIEMCADAGCPGNGGKGVPR